MRDGLYAIVKVGKLQGQTLKVSTYNDDYITLKVGSMHHEYYAGEYELVSMFGRPIETEIKLLNQ